MSFVIVVDQMPLAIYCLDRQVILLFKIENFRNGQINSLNLEHQQTIAEINQAPKSSTMPLEKLAREGDKVAFSELVEIYWTPIYCYLFRLIGQSELAADITQETFFKAYQNIGEIHANQELFFRPWIYRIATNMVISEIRRTKKHRLFSLDWFDDRFRQSGSTNNRSWNWQQLLLTDQGAGPAEQSLASEQSREISTIFEQLPNQQTILLLLRFYHELSYEEISQVLGGLRVEAVRARLHRARLAFCRLYEKLEIKNNSKG